jgi:hypothetical protein
VRRGRPFSRAFPDRAPREPWPDAMDPGFHCVRTPWIRGFMAFRLVRRVRTVVLVVLVVLVS